MADAPAFFVPEAGDDSEMMYQGFAQMAGASPAAPGKRIYSITFSNHGERWRATVGETLVRVEPKSPPKTDPGRVLAIYPGSTYVVVHDGGPRTGPPTAWNMPILAGVPGSVTHFAILTDPPD